MITTLLAAMLAASTSCVWTIDRVEEGADGTAWAVMETPGGRTVSTPAEYLPGYAIEGARLCVIMDPTPYVPPTRREELRRGPAGDFTLDRRD